MPQIIETTVYKFSELSDKAKQKALEWMRYNREFYADQILGDAKEAAFYLGIEIDKIYYSGFYKQGDGACFVGKFDSSKCQSLEFLENLYAKDEILKSIVKRIIDLENITAKITRSGMYCHAYSMDFDIENENCPCVCVDEKEVKEILRRFANRIYSNLQKEYDWQMSDECLAEEIEANDYTFTADGVRFG